MFSLRYRPSDPMPMISNAPLHMGTADLVDVVKAGELFFSTQAWSLCQVRQTVGIARHQVF